MRLKTVLVLGGLCVFGGACSPLARHTRTASCNPCEQVQREDVTDSKHSSKLAALAWDQTKQANPEIDYTPDFAEGFKKGFADYLQTGTSEPPAVPPRCYGPLAYESVQGRQAVLDWFRGFHEGTVEAQASALRPVPSLPRPEYLPDAGAARPLPAAPPSGRAERLPMPALVESPPQDAAADQVQGGGHCPL